MNDKNQSGKRKASGLNTFKNANDPFILNKKELDNIRSSFKQNQNQEIRNEENIKLAIDSYLDDKKRHQQQDIEYENQQQLYEQVQQTNQSQQIEYNNEDIESTKSFEIQRDDINQYFYYQSQKTNDIQRLRNEIQNLEKEKVLYSSFEKNNQRHSFPLQNANYRNQSKNLLKNDVSVFPNSTRNQQSVIQNSNMESLNQTNQSSNDILVNNLKLFPKTQQSSKENISKFSMNQVQKQIDGIGIQRGDYSSRNQDENVVYSNKNQNDFTQSYQDEIIIKKQTENKDNASSKVKDDLYSSYQIQQQIQIPQQKQQLSQQQQQNQQQQQQNQQQLLQQQQILLQKQLQQQQQQQQQQQILQQQQQQNMIQKQQIEKQKLEKIDAQEEKIKQLELMIETQNKFISNFQNQQENYYSQLYQDIKKQYEQLEQQSLKDRKEGDDSIAELKKQLKTSQEENIKKQKSLINIVNSYNRLKIDYESMLKRDQESNSKQFQSYIYPSYEIESSSVYENNMSNNLNNNSIHPPPLQFQNRSLLNNNSSYQYQMNIKNITHDQDYQTNIYQSASLAQERDNFIRQSKESNYDELDSKQSFTKVSKEWKNENYLNEENINNNNNIINNRNQEQKDKIRKSMDYEEGNKRGIRNNPNYNQPSNNKIISNSKSNNRQPNKYQENNDYIRYSQEIPPFNKIPVSTVGNSIDYGESEVINSQSHASIDISGVKTAGQIKVTNKKFAAEPYQLNTNREGQEDLDDDINLFCDDEDILLRQSLQNLQKDNKLFDNFFSPRQPNAKASTTKLDSTQANSYEKIFKSDEKILEQQYWSSDLSRINNNLNNNREHIEDFSATQQYKKYASNNQTEQNEQSEDSVKQKRKYTDSSQQQQHKQLHSQTHLSNQSNEQNQIQVKPYSYQNITQSQLSVSSQNSLPQYNPEQQHQIEKINHEISISPMKIQNQMFHSQERFDEQTEQQLQQDEEFLYEKKIQAQNKGIKETQNSLYQQQSQLFKKALSNNSNKQQNPLLILQAGSLEQSIEIDNKSQRKHYQEQSIVTGSVVESFPINNSQSQTNQSQGYQTSVKIQDSFNKLLSKSYSKVSNSNNNFTTSNITNSEINLTENNANIINQDNQNIYEENVNFNTQQNTESSSSTSLLSPTQASQITQETNNPSRLQKQISSNPPPQNSSSNLKNNQNIKQSSQVNNSKSTSQNQYFQSTSNLKQNSINSNNINNNNKKQSNIQSTQNLQQAVNTRQISNDKINNNVNQKSQIKQQQNNVVTEIEFQPSPQQTQKKKYFSNNNNYNGYNKISVKNNSSSLEETTSFGGFFNNNSNFASQNQTKNNNNNINNQAQNLNERQQVTQKTLFKSEKMKTESSEYCEKQIMKQQLSQRQSSQGYSLSEQQQGLLTNTSATTADISDKFTFNYTDRNIPSKNPISSQPQSSNFTSQFSNNSASNQLNSQQFNPNLKSSASFTQNSTNLKKLDNFSNVQINNNSNNILGSQISPNSTKQWLHNSYQLAQAKHQQNNQPNPSSLSAVTSQYQIKTVYDNNYMSQPNGNSTKNYTGSSTSALNFSQQFDNSDKQSVLSQPQLPNTNKRVLNDKVNKILEGKKQYNNNNQNSMNINNSENINNGNNKHSNNSSSQVGIILSPASKKSQQPGFTSQNAYKPNQNINNYHNNNNIINNNNNQTSHSNELYSPKQRFHTLEY